MNKIHFDKISELQKQISCIRNVCILAHVDHGKTSLADALISSNGIISPKLAGKLRYMDSREDEQLKGITMKSSAISLHYNSDSKDYLINLIDSPGHIDFYGEVSTVVRLCDGAIIIVDAVEGICPQTQAVLRQAWIQNIKPVLVINKIDRLILELKMSPEEAEIRLTQLLEQINAVTGELLTTEVLAKSSLEESHKKDESEKRQQFDLNEWGTGLEELDDSLLYFSPDQGNVVFSSAIDGWGFRISDFATKFARRKGGVSREVLNKTLWGDFYIDSKTKTVKKSAKKKGKKTLFVQLILENIWKIYECVCVQKEKHLVEELIKKLELKIPLKHMDHKRTLQSIFQEWLPLSHSVLEMVSQLLPDPKNISNERIQTFLKGNSSIDSIPSETMSLKDDLSKCSSSDNSPTIIFISKMFPFEKKFLPQNQPKPLTSEERASKRELILKRRQEIVTSGSVTTGNIVPLESHQEIEGNANEKFIKEDSQTFIAFARIFSGTIKKGQWLYVFGPRHDPNCLKGIDLKDDEKLKCMNIMKIQVQDLYLLMGRDLECLDIVPAGNIFGFGGLEEFVYKSGSLSDNLFCPSFTDLFQEVSPIVRVAVEPKHTNDLHKLVHGLKLLSQSDPCVEVFMQETGEHVMVTSGEVHLEKCIDDLQRRFALVDITVSSPIVPFRETIVPPPVVDRVNENIVDQISTLKLNKKESPSIDLVSDSWHLTVRAVPLSPGIIKFLGDNSDLLKIYSKKISSGKLITTSDQTTLSALTSLKEKLIELCQEEMEVDESFIDCLWSVDPRRSCTNLLINKVPEYDRPSFWDFAKCSDNTIFERLKIMDRSIINGFEVACNSGPLCEEPLSGVCFVVEKWIEMKKKEDSDNLESSEEHTNCDKIQFKGSLISLMKECCRRSFQAKPQRLMWAMYTCVIQATSEVLGKMYGVLGKRNGRILSEEMREGSTTFQVSAALPVVESFGFADEFRKKTSGLAMPQLKFSHWEVIDVDPFWVPTTDEEYTHFGDKADTENVARKYMNDIRRRKGLRTTEKLVEFGEKQRTLKRNK